ncbi:MAG: cupredoxin domain-containing protein [Gammaproteobacteria bacterium]|nr:cupredoxin domain-containing protein [Gammaproteobacteria bacterium]
MAFLLMAFAMVFTGYVHAAGLKAYHLTIKDGRFIPETVEVKAGERFKIVVHNEGPGPEEFESKELRKETVLAEGVTRSVVFAPLKPGTYSFFGEFHPDTAKGQIVAK